MVLCPKETVKGIMITTVGAVGIGTAIDVASLFAVGVPVTVNEITVFNDANAPVRVQWLNDNDASEENFIVPNGGKSYTRKLNKGNITPASLKLYSLTATALTGNVVINLALN